MLEERVRELKAIIARNDGSNAADRAFARAVDELVRSVYDDIGEIRAIPSRTLFDLFVIKVLYVGRRSRHADVIEYLGAMLDSYLYARELFPAGADGRPRRVYFSDVVQGEGASAAADRFEAYRRYGDSALFLSGVFSASARRRRPSTRGALRRQATRGVDAAYYVNTGKAMYRMASRQDQAERTRQRATLLRLADGFEVYVDALSEMSERYLMGFDMGLIADRMLDSFNRYRASRDERDLTDARRYAALLRLDRERFPALYPPD